MEFTGERIIPGQVDPDLLNEHVARYRFAEALVGGRNVLDAGCGLAYGSELLAAKASRVWALDVAGDALRAGRESITADNVAFLQGSAAEIPLADGSVDVVVAFEVIEHLENWAGFLSESRRVLKPDGQLLVSTPNRPYYEQTRSEPNPFHVHEFDYEEFRTALTDVFPHATIFLENHTNAITFTPSTVQGLRAKLESGAPRAEDANFFLAVCSMSPLYGSPAFVYVPRSGNVLKEREHHIGLLDKWLDEAKAELAKLTVIHLEDQEKAQREIDQLQVELSEKTAWAKQLDEAMQAARAELEKVNVELAERAEWVKKVELDQRRMLADYQALEAEAEKRSQELQKAIGIIDELEARVKERSEWAQSVQAKLDAISASRGYRFMSKIGLAPK